MDEADKRETAASAELAGAVGFAASTGISSRHYIASQHLWAARHQARLCAELEADDDAAPFDIRHRTFAIGTVLSSVAFLEALVNEIFQDAADSATHISGRIEPLGEHCIALMAEFWNASEGGSRYVGVLDKFQMALLFADKPKFDSGANPYQDTKLLIGIRNRLVHFRPAWQTQGDIGRDEQRMRGKFADNRLMSELRNPWFPDKCLGAGCAEWSWQTSLRLADEWATRLEIPLTYVSDLGSWPQP
jgi:hypothetical protein